MDFISRVLGSAAGGWLSARFADTQWSTFRAAVAFAKSSGVKYFGPEIYSFARRPNTTVKLAVGISSQGTSLEAMQDLWRLLHGHGDLFVYHEGPGGYGSFHPKAYLFKNPRHAELLIGSTNLTEGGLYANHELSVATTLDLTRNHDKQVLASYEQALDAWQTVGPACKRVDPAVLAELHTRGDLPSEASITIANRLARGAARAHQPRYGAAAAVPPSPFRATQRYVLPQPLPFPSGLPAAPVAPMTPAARNRAVPNTVPPPPATATQLFIEVNPHHNGEVFLSKLAVNDDPAFFRYPFTGWAVPKNRNNPPYPQLTPDPVVDIVVYGNNRRVAIRRPLHPLNVVFYAAKAEIRITIPADIVGRIPQRSLLVMTKNPSPTLDYRLEFYPPGSAPEAAVARLTRNMPSGGNPPPRRYGW